MCDAEQVPREWRFYVQDMITTIQEAVQKPVPSLRSLLSTADQNET